MHETQGFPRVSRRSLRRRRRQWLFRAGAVAVGLAAVVVAAAAVEVWLRWTRTPERYFPHVAHTVLRWGPANAAITPGIDGYAYISTNALGCRGPEPGRQTHRMLVVGGSTALCIALDDSEAWPGLLMSEVNARAGDDGFLWVTNAGMEGRDSRHHLVHAELLVPRLPGLDHVLVYCGLNDVVKWMRWAFVADASALDESDDGVIARSFSVSDHHPRARPWYRRLEIAKLWGDLQAAAACELYASRSQDYVAEDTEFWQGSRGFLDQQIERVSSVGERRLDAAQMATLSAAVHAYEGRLRSIVDRLRQHGNEPILMAQFVRLRDLTERERYFAWWKELEPDGPYASPDQMQDCVEAYNLGMKRVADQRGVVFVDLPALAASAAGDGEFAGLFHDGVHFSERGSRVVAERVAEFLGSTVFKN